MSIASLFCAGSPSRQVHKGPSVLRGCFKTVGRDKDLCGGWPALLRLLCKQILKESVRGRVAHR